MDPAQEALSGLPRTWDRWLGAAGLRSVSRTGPHRICARSPARGASAATAARAASRRRAEST